MSLLSFYSLAFCVAALSGLLLPLVGKHLRARGRVLEVFFLAQLALTGSLAARLILTHHVSDIWTLGFSLFVYILGKYVLEIKRNAFSDFDLWMIGGYLSLLSIQYLLIGVFPQLDTHMTAVFFGNLVTASNVENYILIFGCGAVLVAYWVCRRKVNRSTIEQSIFGNSRIQVVDFVLFAFPVVLSLYSLGFLYTMSFLLLPSLFLGSVFSTERVAVFALSLIACLGSVAGLYVSIAFERVSTTAAQVICLVLSLGLLFLVKQSYCQWFRGPVG